jgi:hypothetical protein
MVCFVSAFAKLSTAKSASFDDIRKGYLHKENIIFVIKNKKGFADKLSAECDQHFCYKELSNENAQRWFKFDLSFTFSDVMNKLAYWDPGFGWKSFTVRHSLIS